MTELLSIQSSSSRKVPTRRSSNIAPRWWVQMHDAEAVMPNSRTNKADKNSAVQWIKTRPAGVYISVMVYRWALKLSGGRHQQEVRSTGRPHLERRYDCMCWFGTGSAYIWFRILWWEWQLVEGELRREWQPGHWIINILCVLEVS